MEVIETGIAGLLLIKPKVFGDTRGFFLESYNKQVMEPLGVDINFIQDNQSRSARGVIRGLHYQEEPYAQTKLVRVTEGSVFDVALDLRKGSSSYGQWYGAELSAGNFLQLLIPKGFAHGFSVLSEFATVQYKCDTYYHPQAETGIRFDDPGLNIDWKVEPVSATISDKDRTLPFFKA